MSYDLFLLALPNGADAAAGLDQLAGLEAGTATPAAKCDRHVLAKLLMELEPRYTIFEKDYEEIANFEGITSDEARRRDDCVELDGESNDGPLAQFIIHDDRVEVHWYPGTSEAQMNSYLRTLCHKAGYNVLNPQDGSIANPQD